VKLLSFAVRGEPSYGALARGGVVDLALDLRRECPGLRELLERGDPRVTEEIVSNSPPDHALDEVVFLPPIPTPEKIICVGVNYANRNEEYRDGSERPRYPSIFMRTPGSLVGHRANLLRPLESPQLDYEGEIAVIIGKGGRRIAPSAARDHVAGLTCMNEGTVRDWTRHAKFNVTQGKNFDRSGSMGPWLVTADEFESFDAIRLTTRVNGEIRQDDTTTNMLFSIPQLISYVSTFTTLKPGDVIATGTPTGAGARLDPPRFLVPGDVVEVEVAGVGILVNTVADETLT
jgi:2-keto-4-pentenoate hydratase/2-oxohepta-3-ene-1,7-dioic acid hydratase in catechol pathway